MATASATLSLAKLAVTGAPARTTVRIKPSVKYIGGQNTCSGLTAPTRLTSLGQPLSNQAFGTIVSSRKRGGGGRGLSIKCSATSEIFTIAAIINGLVLVGVAVGFVLLRLEAAVEEAE